MNNLENYSDKDLLDELVRRCHERLSEAITATADEKLRNHLYEAGKLILIRAINN